ncbi:hypothetical protein MNV49_000279 [Pseudohyphozyma bogoriensis]|nr:hypothetical protein MNV49_000279 [Pseudohyphozyma bogoriensis]
MADTFKRRLGQVADHIAQPTPAFVQALEAKFPADQLSLDEVTRSRFGTSFGSLTPPAAPSVVVHAESTADVVATLAIAREYNVVVIPVGGRTSLEGQFSVESSCTCDFGPAKTSLGATKETQKPATRPTIHLSLSNMDKVLAVHAADSQAVVEPGVGWESLNKHLADHGIPLFFPIDPAPRAEFGGMVGVGGSGTNAVGYGTMRGEWIQGMEVVLMSGEVINTRGSSRSRKSSTGWDVGRLFLGSEGTLGIITKLVVRLAPVAPLSVALTSFPTVALAVSAVVDIIAAGLAPTSLELLDGTSIRGLNMSEILPYALPEEPTVLLRFTSALPAATQAALQKADEIVQKHGGKQLTIGKDEKENELIWRARKNQYWSQQMLVGEGCQTLITDCCVPISRLAEFVERSEVDVNASGLLAPIVAHIGDGNVHRAILFKAAPGATEPPPEVVVLASKLSKLAIELEGTCAGEHGIGVKKRQYLKHELGKGTLKVMRDVKNMLDPLGLLNPGKVLYEREEDE